jgi:hypothetical protein
MVQKPLLLKKFIWVILRIVLFIIIILGSAFICEPFYNFLTETLAYTRPSGFFGFTFADWELAWFLTFTLLGGIIFGALGKKIDYFFIAILIALDIWEWTGTENITPSIWMLLIAVIVGSNAIGFALKLLRQKFLPNWKV